MRSSFIRGVTNCTNKYICIVDWSTKKTNIIDDNFFDDSIINEIVCAIYKCISKMSANFTFQIRCIAINMHTSKVPDMECNVQRNKKSLDRITTQKINWNVNCFATAFVHSKWFIYIIRISFEMLPIREKLLQQKYKLIHDTIFFSLLLLIFSNLTDTLYSIITQQVSRFYSISNPFHKLLKIVQCTPTASNISVYFCNLALWMF